MAKTTKKPANKAAKPAKETAKDSNKEFITKDMPIGEVVQKYPDTAEVMFKHGMHCIGCHIAAFETVEQGAMAHGIDVDKFMKDLNKAAKKTKKEDKKE